MLRAKPTASLFAEALTSNSNNKSNNQSNMSVELVVSVTPSVQRALQQAAQDSNSDDSESAAEFSAHADATFVPLAALRRAVSVLQKRHGTDGQSEQQWRLHNVMRGALLSVPPREKAPRDPEVLARLERLRNAHDAREYRKLVGDVNLRNYETSREETRTSLRDTNTQLSLGLNMLVSALTVFIAIFWYGRDQYGPHSHWPWIGGLLGAIAILIIETVLFIVRASRITYDEPAQPRS